MYFRLNPECYFIKGMKQGAIFDMIDCKIYALSPKETEILTSCEKNKIIDKEDDFLKELRSRTLGTFYQNKQYIQKLRFGSFIEKELNTPPEFYRAFLQINDKCDKNCWFCGYNGLKRSLGCLGCNKWENKDKPLDLKKWKEIIEELYDLGCNEIFFNGGDLSINWDETMEILEYSQGKFINTYITLHQHNLSEKIIKDLKNKTNLIIQTEDYNDIKFDNFLYLYVTKPEFLINKENIKENVMIDFIIEDKIDLDNLAKYKKDFPQFNLQSFLNNIEYHPCLGHTLTICSNGDVLSCPMMRDSNLGNLKNKTLVIYLEKNLMK
ncbi:MAG: radical SAM protein [Methanobacterium sp.]